MKLIIALSEVIIIYEDDYFRKLEINLYYAFICLFVLVIEMNDRGKWKIENDSSEVSADDVFIYCTYYFVYSFPIPIFYWNETAALA